MAPARRPDLAGAAVLLAVVAALAGPPPALASDEGQPAAGGSLRITADPPRLVLGRDGAAELRIAAPGDLQDLALSVSAGRVEDLRRLPGGGFAARYRPPPGRVPQVAIVAASGRTASGPRDGFVAIPLSGHVDVRVRATPGASIALRIGDVTYGPSTVGHDGRAVLPAVVPPGVREAHHGFRPFDLRVPETSLLHAVLERPVVYADRQERVRVVAYVVAPHGTARRGDVPLFEATRGTVAAAEREPGMIEGVWTLPPGRAGEERLVVRLGGLPASRAVLKLDGVPGPAAAVAVAFDADALVAGAEPVTVTAHAIDAAGNPVAAALQLGAEGAELFDVRERELGAVEGRLRAGAFGAHREVRVIASAAGAGLSAARALPLRPGEAAAAHFVRGRNILPADGARVARLRLAVADRHGNAIALAPVVSVDKGEVLSVTAAGPGTHEIAYRAPAVTTPTPAHFVASVGPLRTTAERVLVPPEPRRALAFSSGMVRDVRGRFSALRTSVAVERTSDLELAQSFDLSWRFEGSVLGTPDGPTWTLLGGASAVRGLGPSVVLRGSASAGAIVGRSLAGPAARLAVELAGTGRRPVAPFVEASLLAAGRGAPGTFAAATISVGVRLGLEGRAHGHDPDRR
jgi:hypothetical protein